ncbi:MAG: ABC transporter ATP-binding protein/permease [Actinomycetota bacterium]|nr:ABC transporter ATP-binding protein/permease [Actinomycetota bacterium]
MSTILPVATGSQVRRYAMRILRTYPRPVYLALALHGFAALAALAGPRLLGDLVEAVEQGTTLAHVNKIVLVLATFLIAQTVLTRYARYVSFVLGERVLAELREGFVESALALPVGVVESAGSGDLLTRTSRDVEQLGWSVRWALPEWVIAVIAATLTFLAALTVGWWVAVPCLLGVPPLVVGLKWYLARAKNGYLRESASYSSINASLTETVEGARTVEALGLGEHRIRQVDSDIAGSYAAERYTLFLRTVFFPSVEIAYLIPTVATLLFGGYLYTQGSVSLGDVTAATLYVQMLIDPVDRIVSILDELQIGAASLARLLGVAHVPDDRQATGRVPRGEQLEARGVRFSYVEGRDVLHGVDLSVGVGERIAMVGPSGAGKSTLGRLLAGIHPPRTGSVDVGGVGLTELSLTDLRGHVALVTQEHHVFVGSLRENLALAVDDQVGSPGNDGSVDDQLLRALEAVDARDWVEALPEGLDTVVGSGGRSLTPAQAQQLALARLVLADPHTLVLDEATSLIDPRAARHLERSLAVVLHGRTVIAIAHRLFSAHDADRVAVVEDGSITEIGSHDELVKHGGSYAALWSSWHGDHESPH